MNPGRFWTIILMSATVALCVFVWAASALRCARSQMAPPQMPTLRCSLDLHEMHSFCTAINPTGKWLYINESDCRLRWTSGEALPASFQDCADNPRITWRSEGLVLMIPPHQSMEFSLAFDSPRFPGHPDHVVISATLGRHSPIPRKLSCKPTIL